MRNMARWFPVWELPGHRLVEVGNAGSNTLMAAMSKLNPTSFSGYCGDTLSAGIRRCE